MTDGRLNRLAIVSIECALTVYMNFDMANSFAKQTSRRKLIIIFLIFLNFIRLIYMFVCFNNRAVSYEQLL